MASARRERDSKNGAIILDQALTFAPAGVVLIGLAVVGTLVVVGRSGAAGPIAIATLVVALAAAVRLWIARPAAVEVPFLSVVAGSAEAGLSAPILAMVRLDSLALVALTASVGLGLLAAIQTASGDSPRPSTIVAILLLTLLALILVTSDSVSSLAALWAVLALALAMVTHWSSGTRVATPVAVAFGPATTPSGDARRTLRLVIVGAPLFGVIACALVAVAGSDSFDAGQPVPVGIVIALVVAGAVIAGVAPFGTRHFPHHGLSAIALVRDGTLPIAGVLLAERAVGLSGAKLPLALTVVLVLVGLFGLVAALAARRGEWLGEVGGRIEGSLALLVLVLPTPAAPVLSMLVASGGAVARAIGRLPSVERAARPRWFRRGEAVAAGVRAVGPTPDGEIWRHRVISFERQMSSMVVLFTETLASAAREIEGRYGLAIGLVVALATLFIFYG